MDSHNPPVPPSKPPEKPPKKVAKSVEERPQNAHYSDVQRLQALALYEAGIPAAVAAERAGIKSAKTVSNIVKKAQSRGYDRNVSTVLKLEYVSDGVRSGRPRKADKKDAEGDAAVNIIDQGRPPQSI